jgi:anti-sigma B factor antagonist
MTMTSTSRTVDAVTILDLSGRIVLGEDTLLLRNTIRDLIANRQRMILLNMGEVPYIDSSAIGELVTAFTTVRKQGGALKLLNLTEKVYDVLQITKLYTVLDVKEDEAEAIRSFAPAEVGHTPLSVMRMFGS